MEGTESVAFSDVSVAEKKEGLFFGRDQFVSNKEKIFIHSLLKL